MLQAAGIAPPPRSPLASAHTSPIATEYVSLNMGDADDAPSQRTDEDKAEAFVKYLDDMVKAEIEAKISWGQITLKVGIAILGFVSGIPNWKPAYNYGEDSWNAAWGAFLAACGAVSYCSFNTFSFLSLIDALMARKDKVSTEEGNAKKGFVSSVIYGAALLITAMILSVASAFQAFKLNTNVSAYIFGAIDLITNTVTNALSLQKLGKLPAIRILLKFLYGIMTHPTQIKNLFADGKQSWVDIYGFLKMCDLTEDDIANLKDRIDDPVSGTTLLSIIFSLGQKHSDDLDARYYGYDKYIRWAPVFFAAVLGGFSGWYYQLAFFEAISFIFSSAGVPVVDAIEGLTTFLSIMLAFVPTYLEFYVASHNLSAVYNAFPTIASQLKELFSDIYHAGFKETLTALFTTDMTNLKESDLLFKHSKFLFGTFKFLLITTFFAWGQRAGAITKLDNIDGLTKEVVKIFNILNNICYKSGAMWKLTDSIGLGVVKHYGEKVLAEAAKFVSSLRKFSDVASDISLDEMKEFLKKWKDNLLELETEVTGLLAGASMRSDLPEKPKYNQYAHNMV